jgi:hypothetical protein
MKAPVVIFTYNRPTHLRDLLQSLREAAGIDNTIIYVLCDGPRNEIDAEKQVQIVDLVQSEKEKGWCKSLVFRKSSQNNGLASSIVSGVNGILDEHGKVIVLEDDLIVSPGFLNFMNKALDLYEQSANVFAISGYMFPINTHLRKSVLLPFTSSWGWATWKSKWRIFSIETPAESLLKPSPALKNRFNIAHYNYHHMLLTERNKSWAINWYYQVFVRNGLSVYPSSSLLINNGFDGSGENCGHNIFREKGGTIADDIEVVLEDSIDVDFYNEVLKYFGTSKQKIKSMLRYVPFKKRMKRLLKI